MNRRIGCGFLIWVFSSLSAFSAQITNIALAQQANKTILYCSINGSFTHKIMALANPNRIVIDLNGVNSRVNVNQLGIRNSLIKKARSGRLNANTLRLVFEVNQQVQVTSAPWQEHGVLKGLRIDLRGSTPLKSVAHYAASIPHHPNYPNPKKTIPITKTSSVKTPSTKGKNVVKKTAADYQKPLAKVSQQRPAQLPHIEPVVQPPRITHSTPIKVSHSPSKSLRDVIIVLDAGHGGKDPGAKGPRNSKEKNVVLAITLKLKQLIDKQPGMHAVLTRSGDYYVELRERLNIARKYNGDIFVSIHADAFNNPHSNGASVFALSQGGATSEAARWIAAKENYSELGGVNLGDLDDTNGVVRSVLIDLSQTATINSSLQMGRGVLNQLDNFTRLHNNKVEQARFMVLKSPDIPSILIETGFISNPREERNLTSPAYQTQLSQAIFNGIKGYFWNNPPHGTRIEAMLNNNVHIVKAGETLPNIAARYRVSISAMQSINHLSRWSRLKPGQKLVIPATWA